MTWEWTSATVLNVAGAGLIALFGALVLTVRPRTSQAIAVGVFGVAFGIATGGINIMTIAGSTGPVGPIAGMVASTGSAVSIAVLLVMWRILPSRLGSARSRYLLPGVFAVLGLALALPLLLGRVESPTVAVMGPSARVYFALAGVLMGVWWALVLLLASRFARQEREAEGAPVLAVALSVYPSTTVNSLFGGDPALERFAWLNLVFIFIVAGTWLWAGHRAGRVKTGRNVAWTILGVTLAALIEGGLGGDAAGPGLGLNGLSRIACVAILSYAVVRHHVLGIDVKVRWTISKSTLAAVFVAVFFVASEVAQQFLGETTGSAYLGIAAAGALVFVIAPLQRAAERLAVKAVPVADGSQQMAEPQEAYRRHVEIAWSDGRLGAKERLILQEARQSLRITLAEADRIERDVAYRFLATEAERA